MSDNKIKILKRGIFQRLFGKCVTELPANNDCWSYASGVITVDLNQAKELDPVNGALRIESKELPNRVLVIYGEDNEYHAYRNHCEHAKRRLDPVPGTETIQCCSIGKSTYDYSGKILNNDKLNNLTVYPVEFSDGKLTIKIG
ncbi:MAG: Rieske 2Fe-2S domain-containing protein [candidate division Zixibacteria bacterium]|nr:Rieske 2Fe-2S domain-containing protein [candidate division Zixibacteria bacterium]